MIGDPFTMVVAIVLIGTIGGILRARYKAMENGGGQLIEDQTAKALEQEVTQLRERVKVLERIAVEKEDTLTRQIEQLRDK